MAAMRFVRIVPSSPFLPPELQALFRPRNRCVNAEFRTGLAPMLRPTARLISGDCAWRCRSAPLNATDAVTWPSQI